MGNLIHGTWLDRRAPAYNPIAMDPYNNNSNGWPMQSVLVRCIHGSSGSSGMGWNDGGTDVTSDTQLRLLAPIGNGTYAISDTVYPIEAGSDYWAVARGTVSVAPHTTGYLTPSSNTQTVNVVALRSPGNNTDVLLFTSPAVQSAFAPVPMGGSPMPRYPPRDWVGHRVPPRALPAERYVTDASLYKLATGTPPMVYQPPPTVYAQPPIYAQPPQPTLMYVPPQAATVTQPAQTLLRPP